MEYITYILIILGIMVLCHFVLRDPEQSLTRDEEPGLLKKIPEHLSGKKATNNSAASELPNASHTPGIETLNVPTPWGWPGHDNRAATTSKAIPNAQEVHDVSESLHRFVSRLLSEKQTVEDREYLLKKDASMKALFEDRYGRAGVAPDAGNPKTGTPPLSDPDKAHEMDSLRQMKTPWGW